MTVPPFAVRLQEWERKDCGSVQSRHGQQDQNLRPLLRKEADQCVLELVSALGPVRFSNVF